MEKKTWREAFIDAMELIEESYPDAPVLLIAATYDPDSEDSEFPCAIGGRNMDNVPEKSTVDMIAAILRTVWELCLEYAGGDEEGGKRVYNEALKCASGFNISEKEEETRERTPPPGEDVMERMAIRIQDILKKKLEEEGNK
tara:strand:- start:1242 stop:1667 length:426 start_codon:yes stop_codon:yes gene_type:complete